MSFDKRHKELKDFSEKLHIKKQWYTRISTTRNPFIRFFIDHISFKRKEISKLASLKCSKSMVLDSGAGNGAYSHWFLGKNKNVIIIAVDWSFEALKNYKKSDCSRIFTICADVHCLPIKPGVFNKIFSIDTLGHVSNIPSVLDELFRVATDGSCLFLHSECSDYQCRWPDSMLIKKNKKDILAEYDGHFSLQSARTMRALYGQRFVIKSFYSPAGIMGWLLGYPEKYVNSFKKSGFMFFYLITLLFSFIKKIPLCGYILKLVNAWTNKLELFFGVWGGGSCFATLKKPGNKDK